MTIHDLYALQNVRATEAVIKNRLDALKRYGDANAGVKKVLHDALIELAELENEEEAKLRALAQSVEDRMTREIIRKRFIDGKPWVEVAAEVVPLEKDATRTAPLKRVERFLKNF